MERLKNIENLENKDIGDLYNCKIQFADKSIDD